MYAVIKTGGKQYPVKEGQLLKIELLNAHPGDVVTFDEVLMLSKDDKVQVGNPIIETAKVIAEVVRIFRGPKIKIFKLRRRKHSRRRMGHKQWHTEVKITQITTN